MGRKSSGATVEVGYVPDESLIQEACLKWDFQAGCLRSALSTFGRLSETSQEELIQHLADINNRYRWDNAITRTITPSEAHKRLVAIEGTARKLIQLLGIKAAKLPPVWFSIELSKGKWSERRSLANPDAMGRMAMMWLSRVGLVTKGKKLAL